MKKKENFIVHWQDMNDFHLPLQRVVKKDGAFGIKKKFYKLQHKAIKFHQCLQKFIICSFS